MADDPNEQAMLGFDNTEGVRQAQAQARDAAAAGGDGQGSVNAQALLGYVANTFGGTETPGLNSSWSLPLDYPMTGDAQAVMARQNFPIDPNRVSFRGPGDIHGNGGGFVLDNNPSGPDLFGGMLPGVNQLPLSRIPKALQPFLAPALVRYYKQNDYQGGAARGEMSAPWTQFFAPPAPQLDTSQGSTWPGITRYDPWHRSLGEYPNLYS